MKVEIHSHTDRYSPCSKIPARELVAMAEACGYDALFVTDHDTVWSAHQLASLREHCERLLVFPGIEISLPNGHDLLVLGAADKAYEQLKDPSEVLARACADGYLTVLAHPYRRHDALPGYCALVDAAETHTCNHSEPAHIAATHAFLKAHGIAEVYASDAHGLNFMNKFWIETHEGFTTPQEFRRIIVSGRYENRCRSFKMPLPPPSKVAAMAELDEEDLQAMEAEAEPVRYVLP